MQIYVTFGQVHRHKVNGIIFDRNCVAVVEGKDYKAARAVAVEAFGIEFCTTYDKMPDMSFYPRGCIELDPKF